MIINARNLVAALSSLGANVESALLELASVAPVLDAKVRAALFPHVAAPKLRFIHDRNDSGLKYVETPPISKAVCAMHAVDAITRVLDDAQVIQYLEAKFPEHNVKSLVEN